MNKLPLLYKWIEEVHELPKMVQEALKFLGTKEIPGSKHNSIIVNWADRVGIGELVNDDEQAWCGLFMAYIATISGKMIPMKGWDILRALQWVNFGTKVTSAVMGDVLIFKRSGGGHVALYIGEDDTHYHILGGNQNNQVGIMRMPKTSLHAIRRPPYNNIPKGAKVFKLAAQGQVLESAA